MDAQINNIILKERPFTDEESDEIINIMMDPDCKILFDSNKRNHVAGWKFVQQKLSEKGIVKTADKIKNRFSNLKNKYLAIKRELSSGSATPTWRYYIKFQQYMGESPQASPIIIGDSLAEDSEAGNYMEFMNNLRDGDPPDIFIDENNVCNVNDEENSTDQFVNIGPESSSSRSDTRSRRRSRKINKQDNNEIVELLKEKFSYDKARQEKLDKENKERNDALLNVMKNFTVTFTSVFRNQNQ